MFTSKELTFLKALADNKSEEELDDLRKKLNIDFFDLYCKMKFPKKA